MDEDRKVQKRGRKVSPSQTVIHSPGEAGAGCAPALLNLEIQDNIGSQLRAVFDEIIDEPIPDQLMQLLEEMKRKQEGKK